jgi:hypothetical protein
MTPPYARAVAEVISAPPRGERENYVRSAAGVQQTSAAAGYGDAGPAAIFVECRAAATVVAERASSRVGDPGEASDATAAIAARQLAEFEPLDDVEPHTHVMVRTDRDVCVTIDEIEAALDARLARSGRDRR